MIGRVNPTVRGFALLVLVAAAITALGGEGGLAWILFFLRIAFIVVIGLVLYRLWRSRREQLSLWSRRARVAFYGAGWLAIVNLVASFVLAYPVGALETLVFFAIFFACGFAMWRVWRDEHTYGY